VGEKPIEETAGGRKRRRLEWISAILYAFYCLPLHVVVVNKYVQNNSK